MNKQEPKQDFPKFGTKEWNDLARDYFSGKPKQETIEEAFEKWAKNKKGYDKLDVLKFGAEWQKHQSEKMFSEEQMLLAFETGRNFQLTGENNFKELINQFKKQ